MQRQSRTLVVSDGSTSCMACGFVLGPVGRPWKSQARLSVTKVREIPGSTASTYADVVIRHFSCPDCAALLDSETALPEDPFLDDIFLTK